MNLTLQFIESECNVQHHEIIYLFIFRVYILTPCLNLSVGFDVLFGLSNSVLVLCESSFNFRFLLTQQVHEVETKPLHFHPIQRLLKNCGAHLL